MAKNPESQKNALRERMRRRREAVTTARRTQAASAICARLPVRPDVCAACEAGGPVAVYLATPAEIDLTEFIVAKLKEGVRLVAPRWNGSAYEMAELKGLSASDLRAGPHGILEPKDPPAADLPPARLWIVPGLAFSPDGARLGYGGGWYDRLLADVPADVPKVGVCHRFQVVANVPRLPHDIAVTGLADDGVGLDWEWAQGGLVMGIDEAGRGPLVGGVYAAAVCVPLEQARTLLYDAWHNINDSKQLQPAKREALAEIIRTTPGCQWAVASASAAEIDKLNILSATHLAMRRAAEACGAKVGASVRILVDGLAVPDLPYPSQNLVKGDTRSLLVAAASILAKTARDADCDRLERLYPGYGFAKHKGYPTPDHMAALMRLGPCPEHRRSFEPVAQVCPDLTKKKKA